MSLAVAIQMDPIETIDINADSTFAMALEAQARGHALFHYQRQNLAFRDGRLFARARHMRVQRKLGEDAELGVAELLDLGGMGDVLMRQDPTFDMDYIIATQLL